MCVLFIVEIRSIKAGATEATNCRYDPAKPLNASSHPPWSVLIRPTRRATFVGAILDSHTIITTSDAFRYQTPGQSFQMHPFANYTIRVGVGEKIQKMSVSYIKPHPQLAPRREKWTLASNDLVLIYLVEPIRFIADEVGPVCLPNTTFMRQLEKLSPETSERLHDISVGGLLNRGSVAQRSYAARLDTFERCERRWKTDPITKGCACNFRYRACAKVTRPTPSPAAAQKLTPSCVVQGRDSGAVLPVDDQLFLIGFQNYYMSVPGEDGPECGPNTLVYISLLLPGILDWIRQSSTCGPTKFSCDSGTRCVDRKYVCDRKTRSCNDRSDQNSNFCESRAECEPNQFTCSTGLASYCIPAVDPVTNKTAANCNGLRDCPNGEDEDPDICDRDRVLGSKGDNSEKLGLTLGLSMVALFLTATLVVGTYFFIRRRQWQLEELRDMTEEELIDFFEGERHLQLAQASITVDDHGNEDAPAQNQQVVYVEIMTAQGEEESGDGDSGHATDSSTEELHVRRRGYDDSPAGGRSFLFTDPSQCMAGEQIGRGAYGVVLGGTVLGRRAGIKFPNLDLGISSFKVLLLELKILRYIDEEIEAVGGHPNIVRLIAADTSRIRQRILYVALEFYENGNIEEYLKRRRIEYKLDLCGPPIQNMVANPANPKYHLMDVHDAPFQLPYRPGCAALQRLFRWAAEIASGMSFLARKIHHLDLAARNVLLDGDLGAKVGDFSLSRQAAADGRSYHIQRRDKMPAQWLALEVLNRGKCGRKSDVWSYGVTLWELLSLCEEEPWSELRGPDGKFDVGQLVTSLEAGERLGAPKFADEEVYLRMQGCWSADPEGRPEFPELQTYFEKLLHNLT